MSHQPDERPLATVYVLCYGDYFALHGRIINKLRTTLPANVPVVVWANTVCVATQQLLMSMVDQPTWNVVWSDENVPKYQLMRHLFHGDHEPKTPWLIWFDDDTLIVKNDWYTNTVNYIKSKANQNPAYLGHPFYVDHLPGQLEFIAESSWYTGRKWEQVKTKKPGKTVPGITFAQGAYWWLRTDVMKQLDWPDPRLSHNGGDTLLGEAVRQQGLPFHQYFYGIKPNDSKRRGRSERPAGATVDKRR